MGFKGLGFGAGGPVHLISRALDSELCVLYNVAFRSRICFAWQLDDDIQGLVWMTVYMRFWKSFCGIDLVVCTYERFGLGDVIFRRQ